MLFEFTQNMKIRFLKKEGKQRVIWYSDNVQIFVVTKFVASCKKIEKKESFLRFVATENLNVATLASKNVLKN